MTRRVVPRTAIGLLLLCGLLVSADTRVAAQVESPASSTSADYQNRYDIFAGFDYAHFNGIGRVHTTGLYGWNAQTTAWLKPVFGLAASARGQYGHYPVTPNVIGISNPAISQYQFLFGPDFRLWRTPRHALGFHVLIGGVYGKFNSGLMGAQPNPLGLYANQLAFASASGGSFDFNYSPRLAVRLITDYAPTRFGTGSQHEFQGSLGVVYKLGSLPSHR